MNEHLVPEFGDMQLRLTTRELVQSFLTEKLCTGLSWKTVKLIRTTFGTILKAAEADDLLSDKPVLKTRLPRRGPISEKASIAPEKLLELLNAFAGTRTVTCLAACSDRSRIGELLALRWRDVDLEIGCIRVRQTVYEGQFDDPKTRRSKRTVSVAGKGIEILARRNHRGSTRRLWYSLLAGQRR